jgi:ubiquinol-cytochrome c reductase cytochrome c subunit
MSCHTVGGTGALGGGNLGPDLTHVIQRLGEPGVSAALKTIVFPTMQGPFLNKPLTPAEQADLVAFLKQADAMQPPQPAFAPGSLTTNALVVFTIGMAGALLLFGVLLFFWSRHNRYRTIRLPERKL